MRALLAALLLIISVLVAGVAVAAPRYPAPPSEEPQEAPKARDLEGLVVIYVGSASGDVAEAMNELSARGAYVIRYPALNELVIAQLGLLTDILGRQQGQRAIVIFEGAVLVEGTRDLSAYRALRGFVELAYNKGIALASVGPGRSILEKIFQQIFYEKMIEYYIEEAKSKPPLSMVMTEEGERAVLEKIEELEEKARELEAKMEELAKGIKFYTESGDIQIPMVPIGDIPPQYRELEAQYSKVMKELNGYKELLRLKAQFLEQIGEMRKIIEEIPPQVIKSIEEERAVMICRHRVWLDYPEHNAAIPSERLISSVDVLLGIMECINFEPNKPPYQTPVEMISGEH